MKPQEGDHSGLGGKTHRVSATPVLTNRKFRRPKGAAGKADGYILMALLLFVAFLVIATAAIAPSIAMQVKRDREEEMIHRGVQYSRGIKRFFKKFGRYPTRIEELENTNNIRFLRRRYKDPITGKDFRLLHLGEVRMFAQGVPGLAAPGTPIPGGVTAVPGAIGSPGTPGQQVTGTSGFGAQAAFGANAQNPTFNRQNQDVQNMEGSQANPGSSDATAGASTQDFGAQGSGTQDSSRQSSATQPPRTFGDTAIGTNPIFGGGPVVGVASTSHDKSIREFNKKNHYNDWQFIFDSSTDRGGLLTGPAQPPLLGVGGNAGGVPAVQAVPGMGTPAGGPAANPDSQSGGQQQPQPQQPQPQQQ
jgi:type II secretory pathway pseudopilin PulG